MISDTLHKEGKPQDVVAERLAVRRVLDHSILMAFCTNNSDGCSLNGIVKKINSRTWATLQRVDWGWCQYVSRKAATTLAFLISSHSWTGDDIKKDWTAAQCFSFHIKVKFKVLKTRGRVERHKIQDAWSPVWSFCSAMSSPHVGVSWSTVLSSLQSTKSPTWRLGALCALICWQTLWREMVIFFSSRI